MNGEISTAIDDCVETSTPIDDCVETAESRPVVCPRLLGIAFGICCYVSFAAFYFFRPGNPVVSLGQARFTADSLLELSFTILALPFFGITYLYGIRHHEENLDFAIPETAIDLLLVAAIVWVAIGNGIHLTAKLDEQMVSQLTDQQVVGLRANFHYIRQVVGHVFPHIGWQLLFCALMLGQLRRPYRGREHKTAVLYCGSLFGLLFAHGAIAGTCTHIGFILTAISCLGFSYLLRKSGLQAGEVPIIKFFFSSQVTFLLVVSLYWVVFHSPAI
jgi:hypothetical protein